MLIIQKETLHFLKSRDKLLKTNLQRIRAIPMDDGGVTAPQGKQFI